MSKRISFLSVIFIFTLSIMLSSCDNCIDGNGKMATRTAKFSEITAINLSVAADVVTILVDQAMTKDQVDEAEARRELLECNADLAHPADDHEFAMLLERRDWCQARLALLAK